MTSNPKPRPPVLLQIASIIHILVAVSTVICVKLLLTVTFERGRPTIEVQRMKTYFIELVSPSILARLPRTPQKRTGSIPQPQCHFPPESPVDIFLLVLFPAFDRIYFSVSKPASLGLIKYPRLLFCVSVLYDFIIRRG